MAGYRVVEVWLAGEQMPCVDKHHQPAPASLSLAFLTFGVIRSSEASGKEVNSQLGELF